MMTIMVSCQPPPVPAYSVDRDQTAALERIAVALEKLAEKDCCCEQRP